MDCMGSEEEESNDDKIISELLNSAEVMQNPTIPTNNSSTTKMAFQHEFQVVPNAGGFSTKFCDASQKDVMITMQQNSTQYSDAEDLNKMHIRHVHIPYILNGELYQIQTQDGENVTVKCCHCPPDRVYRGSVRSTGNFHMHIKRRHPDLLEKLHDMKVNALLERRDRLLRQRKTTHRNNRNRSTSSLFNSSDMCLFENEKTQELTTTTTTTTTSGSEITFDSTTESGLMHTHNLKIKTVFQRHQMQQREAAQMRNWKNGEYVIMPIDKKLPTNEENEQPVNYSLKSQEKYKNLPLFSSNSSNTIQQPLQDKGDPHDIKIQKLSTNNGTEQNRIICDNNTKRHFSISSASMSSPGVLSTSSSRPYDLESYRHFKNFPPQQNNLYIIKPENLLFNEENEAIDLTLHTDSGIYSNSDDNDSENNINNDSMTNNIRAGTRESNTTDATAITAKGISENANTAKWQHLLMQVENSLRHIQHEMNVRNQIETNRLFLDLAKFKFQNPGFQFNW